MHLHYKFQVLDFTNVKSCSLNILYAIFVVIMFQKSFFFRLFSGLSPGKEEVQDIR